MKSKHDFLDPTQPHILTEQECELVTFFRAFTKTQRQALIRVIFTVALNDKREYVKISDRKLRQKPMKEALTVNVGNQEKI
jgi:hypothetical protein